MCTYYNKEMTERYRRRKRPFYAWKVFLNSIGILSNRYMSGCPEFTKDGFLKSNRKSVKLLKHEKNFCEARQGIHCSLTKAGLGNISWCVVTKVLCNPKDVVAVEGDKNGDICLMKVKVSKAFLKRWPKNVKWW